MNSTKILAAASLAFFGFSKPPSLTVSQNSGVRSERPAWAT